MRPNLKNQFSLLTTLILCIGPFACSVDAESTGGGAALECSSLPRAAQSKYETFTGLVGSRAFVIDANGYLVMADKDGNLVRKKRDKKAEIWIKQATAGAISTMVQTAEGAILFVDSAGDLVEATASKRLSVLLSSVSVPCHLAVDKDGSVLLSERGRSGIRVLDRKSRTTRSIAATLGNPAGLAFSPDYRKLYVGSSETGQIFALSRDESGGWSEPVVLGQIPNAPENGALAACKGLAEGDSCSAHRRGYVCQKAQTGLSCLAPQGCLSDQVGKDCSAPEGTKGTCQGIDNQVSCAPVNPCADAKPNDGCVDLAGASGLCTAEPALARLYCGMMSLPCIGKSTGDSCAGESGQMGSCKQDGAGALSCAVADACASLAEGADCVDSYGQEGTCAIMDFAATAYCNPLTRCGGKVAGDDCTGAGKAGSCEDDGTGTLVCRIHQPCDGKVAGDSCATESGPAGEICAPSSGGTLTCRQPQPCDGRAPGERCVPNDGNTTATEGVCIEQFLLLSEPESTAKATGSLDCYPTDECYGQLFGDSCETEGGADGTCADVFGDGLVLFCEAGDPCAGKQDGESCTELATGNPGTCVTTGDGAECAIGTPCSFLNPGSTCRSVGRTGICSTPAPGTVSSCELHGQLDAMVVDACGSVYVTERVFGTLYRFTADGSKIEEVLSLPGGELPLVQFGIDAGGWDPKALYVSTSSEALLYSVNVGIIGTPLPKSANEANAGNGGTGGSSGVSSEPTGGGSAGNGPTNEVERCRNLIQAAASTEQIPGIFPTEDVTFDDKGYLYWNSGSQILRSKSNGSTAVFVSGIDFAAGMRITPNGDLYVANNGSATLERISPTGERTVVMSGVDLNGVEVDLRGRVYVTNLGGSEVFRYDPETEKTTVLAMTSGGTPNGVTLSPDFKTLYFDSWNGSSTKTVFRLPFDKDDQPLRLENWANHLGTGTHDGMAVDECGFVYVANDGGAGQVVRVNPKNPFDRTVVVERPGETLKNFGWGRGNGWPKDRLYVVSPGVGLFAADVGVTSKSYGW